MGCSLSSRTSSQTWLMRSPRRTPRLFWPSWLTPRMRTACSPMPHSSTGSPERHKCHNDKLNVNKKETSRTSPINKITFVGKNVFPLEKEEKQKGVVLKCITSSSSFHPFLSFEILPYFLTSSKHGKKVALMKSKSKTIIIF